MLKKILMVLFLFSTCFFWAEVFPGADETSPSRAQYFSWINNTNEGPTAEQTQINLDFFAWLRNEYAMQLDIYAFDAGTLDGKRWYGSLDSERFKKHFPDGLDPIYERAKELDIRLGVWGGPDGFGDTTESTKLRTEQMLKLCRDYNFAVFKFDSVAGQLRDEKQNDFAEMMKKCREYAPDLILLNHRLNLGEVGTPHATTFLWEGQETYIDVHLANSEPAPHHRAGALARGLPPNLSRLTEDHGVCLSNALDYWDDELILQAFNRNLILSPQIYCNPWFLRDDEYPKLARIFNLAKQYKTILVNAIELPEKHYGPHAISRGDEKTRLITLRNLTWAPKTYRLNLSSQIGLQKTDKKKFYEVRQYHPGEKILGSYTYDSKIPVTVAPFRSALIRVTSEPDWGLENVTYDVIKDIPNEAITVAVYAQNNVTLEKLGTLKAVSFPKDAEALYEATSFSADNNALEVRALQRSGESNIPQVRKAREAFFKQQTFIDRGIWDKNLFDDDLQTAFYKMQRWNYNWNNDPDSTVAGGALRVDLGSIQNVDEFVLITRDDASMQPLKIGEGIIGQVSTNLQDWHEVRFIADKEMRISMPSKNYPMRYLRIAEAPNWLSEVKAYNNGLVLDRGTWRASNLFGDYSQMKFTRAWAQEFSINDISEHSYLTVAIAGEYGNEAVYAAVQVDGEYVGAPDRAPAYPANTWELQVKAVNGNYAYYIPLQKSWVNKKIKVVVLGTEKAKHVKPQVWKSNRPIPKIIKTMTIERE